MTWIHIQCLKSVTFKKRIVISQPEDECWPKDQELMLPYCASCGRLVGIDELKKHTV